MGDWVQKDVAGMGRDFQSQPWGLTGDHLRSAALAVERSARFRSAELATARTRLDDSAQWGRGARDGGRRSVSSCSTIRRRFAAEADLRGRV